MSYNVRTHTYIVAGLGLTGQACVRFLLEQGAKVKAFDTRENVSLAPELDAIGYEVEIAHGKLTPDYFKGVDTLVLSPGLSPNIEQVQQAKREGIEVIGDVELFARLNRTPVIGITGSNGKTTVTKLTEHLLNACGLNAVAAGNVGLPVLATLANQYDVIVLELSSFQLETTSSLQLHGACILNITEDHLDRHGSLTQYIAAKQRIFQHCRYAVVGRGEKYCQPNSPVEATIDYGLSETEQGFGVSEGVITLNGDALLNTDDITLAGMHNVLNVMAALALCYSLKTLVDIDIAYLARQVSTFISAPHRCIEIAQVNGVRWIDDSKATNVGATIAALEGLAPTTGGNILLIAGGDAKGADLSPLKAAMKETVSQVFALGKDADKFVPLFANTRVVATMDEAVSAAYCAAKPNDVVLLSPACASIDMFDNYIHRAQVFAEAITRRRAS
ncbi:UDP-N-acetylmuramoyl-L-alanine--D-glutamate ligase [Alteromonas sp. 345S023]|uniref:UDP-N-acetylmuramoylalanine--D-glutamate ligase n=1 Tax=Alteromonas profundi TaxID=2696062 RepID=A0A7X5LIV5_9ALTE|nr:UDP-N-acetylmuramoyl-L-alanine--D-glutamate ligase [Alteromonas profundi]NDV90187.1 UDP-N-acetylmuramoyl-L-alanine--D-glutamate ligase [Alteromonas profundi]